MTWPRRPEQGHVAHGGAQLLVVVAALLALCAPAAAQAPDPAPQAGGPAPDPAPQAAPAPAPKPAAPAPAPVQAAPLAAAPAGEPARAPAAAPAAQPRRESAPRRERAKRRRPAARRIRKPSRSAPRMFGTTAIIAPRFVAEPGTLASADARLAALALLVAAAGSLGLIGHLRREMLG